MDFITQNDANRHLIVLVHGLNGGTVTWQGTDQRFVETLTKDEFVAENFDLAIFTYGTKIFQIPLLRKAINLLKGFFKNRPKEDISAFNVGIESISKPLNSELRGLKDKYKTISIIAHSMGGLVTKSALTWVDQATTEKVELFISLSVPHIGAHLAKFGKPLLGNNPQIIDLQAMGVFTTQLNQRFADRNPQPTIVYQWGHQDIVVPEPSAIPTNVSGNYIEATADNHFSVLLIKNSKTNTVYNRIIKELKIVTQPFLTIDISVLQDTPFCFLVDTIASLAKVNVDVSCFSSNELNSKLRLDKIHGESVEDALMQVGNLAIHKMPAYSVKRGRGTVNFVFTKNT